MLPLIPIALSLVAKFVPDLIGKLIGEKAGEVAEQVVGIASSITGKANPQEAHDAIMKDPVLGLEFEKAGMQLELDLYKEDTKRLEIVNQTMQSESKSNSWWQRSWRPFNGFLFGITLFCDYFVSQIIMNVMRSNMIEKMPRITKEAIEIMNSTLIWNHIPSEVYMLWSVVLGVAVGSRGFEKIKQAKVLNGGDMGLKQVLSLFGKGIIGK